MISLWILDLRRAVYSLWVAVRFGGSPLIQAVLGRQSDLSAIGARLRQIFETLGLTYMKLGQYLASRVDLFPEEISRELNRLFERAQPVEFSRIRSVVESQLGRPLEQAFTEFSREPIAAASVAQVHEACTLDGDHVAVKVQRPGIARLFGADMRNLRRFATVVDGLGLLGTVSMREVLSAFTKWTTRELDFTAEGRTADILRSESPPFGTVPLVFWDLTTPEVLTLEFVEGMSLAGIADLIEAGKQNELKERLPNLDLRTVAENLSYILMNQLFVTGFFHGDPHPGNIFVRDDNMVVLLDCGIFGELREDQREYLAAHIENVGLGDIDAAFYYYAKQLTVTDATDIKEFERDGKAVLRRWQQSATSPLARPEDRHLGKYAGEMLQVVRRHHVRISTETLLFWRALEALDATAIRFSQYFDLLNSLRGFFERIRPSPAERLCQTVVDDRLWRQLAQLALVAPDHAQRLWQLGETPAAWLDLEAPRTRRTSDGRANLVASTLLLVTAAVLIASSPPSGEDRIPMLILGAFALVAGISNVFGKS